MMLDGHEEEFESIKELNAVCGRHTHVEKNTKQDCLGNLPEQWRH